MKTHFSKRFAVFISARIRVAVMAILAVMAIKLAVSGDVSMPREDVEPANGARIVLDQPAL